LTALPTQHPSPHRRRIGLTSLLFCLAAPPMAWTAHLTANFVLADRLCFPGDTALVSSGVADRSPFVAYGPSLGALLICLISAAIAWENWRRTRDEKQGAHGPLVEVGEGRSRFMALCGLFVALGFAVATVFDSLSLFMARTCGT
jgi:hypothetical protein